MARKNKRYKNIKLEQNELTPTAIGIFESKKKSAIGTVVILGIFILAVIFLPDISEYVNKYINQTPGTTPKPTTPNNKPNTPPKDNDDNFTAFVDNLKITNDDITISNFVIDEVNLTISYDVTNNLNNSENMEALNYYLEIYNTEQTLIERVKLANEITLSNGAFTTFKRNITTESATTIGFIAIIKKTINDYPLVELTNNEGGIGSMVCSNAHEKVTYKFNEEKLKEVTHEASYLNTETNYQALYEANKLKANNYNSKLGIASTFFEHENGYNITTIVNLNEIVRTYIFNADSFKIDTEPKVVKFEMEAQGFKCE
jgi:hypothetical protein